MLSFSASSLPPPPPPSGTTTAPTAVGLLRGAAARRDASLTSALHAVLLKSCALHCSQPLTASNMLLHAYLQCGLHSHALHLLDETSRRDAATYVALMSAHCRLGAPLDAYRAFSDMLAQHAHGDDTVRPNEFTVAALLQACGLAKDESLGRMVHGYLVTSGLCCDERVVGSLVNMYAKVGDVVSARSLVLRLAYRDVVSWTAIISGCVLNGMLADAFKVFLMMLEDGVLPNNVTMLSVIQACSLTGHSGLFGPVHALVTRLGLEDDVSVVNSLIVMYAKNGFIEEAAQLFENMYLRRGKLCSNPDVLAALTYGCTVSGSMGNGKEIHAYLIKMSAVPSISIENCLMGMYARFEQADSAYLVFNGMKFKDIVSWNTMIACLAKSDYVNEALELFSALHRGVGGLVPDFVTVLSVVQACSTSGLLQQGQMIHGYIIKSGFVHDVSICNVLISMNAKLGRIDFAEQIFKQIEVKDIVSWNSMINAYGIHGDGHSALRYFHQLRDSGAHSPNAITFLSLISACSHSGLISEGFMCFESMRNDYTIEPTMDHYASVVDLLGRSGRFAEAEKFIRDMPVPADSSIWGPLLAACRLHGNVDLAEKAAKELSVLEPESDIWRVSMSNIYALAGRWKESTNIRTEMKRVGLRKETGWSFVDVGGIEGYKFVSADTRHHDAEKIYALCHIMNKHIADVADDLHRMSLVSVI